MGVILVANTSISRGAGVVKTIGRRKSNNFFLGKTLRKEWETKLQFCEELPR